MQLGRFFLIRFSGVLSSLFYEDLVVRGQQKPPLPDRTLKTECGKSAKSDMAAGEFHGSIFSALFDDPSSYRTMLRKPYYHSVSLSLTFATVTLLAKIDFINISAKRSHHCLL